MASSGQDEGLSFVSVDDLEPRLPPRLSRFPAPFDFPNKPSPQVPDVSLILDSNISLAGISATSSLPGNTPNQNSSIPFHRSHGISPNVTNNSSIANSSGMVAISPRGDLTDTSKNKGVVEVITPSPVAPAPVGVTPPDTTNADEFKNMYRDVSKELQEQREAIVRVESKLDKILQFQDEFLSQIFRRSAMISCEVQTNENGNPAFKEIPRRTPTSEAATSKSDTPSRTSTPIAPSSNPWDRNKCNILKRNTAGPLGRILTQEQGYDDSLPSIQFPSFHPSELVDPFSEASEIGTLELEDFDDFRINSQRERSSPVFKNRNTHGSDCSYSSDEDHGNAGSSPIIKKRPPGAKILTNANRVLDRPAPHHHPEGNSYKHFKRQGDDRKVLKTRHQFSKENRLPDRNRPQTPQSSSSLSPSEQIKPNRNHPLSKPEDEVVVKTKKYLETLGVRFTSPNGKLPMPNPNLNRNNNYMIQQNVYNSIYIPTVNCAPAISEDCAVTSGMGSNFHSLAQKYANAEELLEFDALQASANKVPTETTLYGITSSNLSFATKDYLQRYGLVSQQLPPPNPQTPPIKNTPPHPLNTQKCAAINAPRPRDRILDMTAIRNQPKLL